MPIETATYTADLVETNPVAEDEFETAADHIRLLKSVLLATFANITGAVSANHKDLNLLSGLASTPTQLTPFPTGTVALFVQAAAPTGWTQVTSVNDKVFRAVSGTGGGTTSGTWVITGFTIGSTSLTTSTIPAHSHDVLFDGVNHPVAKVEADGIGGASNSDKGGGSNSTNRKKLTIKVLDNGILNPLGFDNVCDAHSHPGVTGDGIWRPKYVDTIMCSKAFV